MSYLVNRFAVLVAATLMVAACGGGGGGGTTSPATPVTVVCPNGSSVTGQTIDAADAACPAGKVVSVTPAPGSTGVPVDAKIVVSTDSSLDVSIPANVSLLVKGSGTAIAVTVTPSPDGKGFTVTPISPLSNGQQYVFSGSPKDSLGRVISVNSSFTVAAMTCAPPGQWNGVSCVAPLVCNTPQVPLASLGACVYPKGSQVTLSGQLSTDCQVWGSQSCENNIANGSIKIIETGLTSQGHAILFAYLRNYTAVFGVNGLWTAVPILDDGTLLGFDIFGGSAQEIDWATGQNSGLLIHIKPTNSCMLVDVSDTMTPAPCV